MSSIEGTQRRAGGEAEAGKLTEMVMDLAEVVARLTHEEDTLAIPEGRLEAQRLAREARHLITKEITPLSPVELLADRMPAHVPATATLRYVASALLREGVGALVVRGTLATAGIITERDLVRAVASRVDPDTELAAHWMHKPLITVDPKDTVLGAGKAMIDHHVRHLVFAEGDQVTGVVSARDVLACLVSQAKGNGGS